MANVEDRVETLEAEMKGMADAIALEGRLNKSRFEAVYADLDVLKRSVAALPRAMAEEVSGVRQDLQAYAKRIDAQFVEVDACFRHLHERFDSLEALLRK